MKDEFSPRAIRHKIRLARLARSAQRLHELAVCIKSEVPIDYDISTLDVSKIAPAILTHSYNDELVTPLRDVAHRVPSNLAFVRGLLVAQAPLAGRFEGLNAVASAVHSVHWMIPRGLRRELLLICETLEWDVLCCDIALPALRVAFRRHRSIGLWRRMLGELARAEAWQEICLERSRHPLLAWLTRRTIRRATTSKDIERVQIAEIIALARCRIGDNGCSLARKWLLPLICRSTGRYLPCTSAARQLSEQLDSPAHVSAIELADAMERGIVPAGNEDYSNFREAFCLATWERLHPAFHDAGILTELERFASEDDRLRFWRHVTPKGAIQ
jgi:hypothetical protein